MGNKQGQQQQQKTTGFRAQIKSKLNFLQMTDLEDFNEQINRTSRRIHYSQDLIYLHQQFQPIKRNMFLDLDTSIKCKIMEFLKLEDVYILKLTCKKLYFERVISNQFIINAIRLKFDIFSRSNMFLEDIDDHVDNLYDKLENVSPDHWVDLIKKDIILKKQLKIINSTDNNISKISQYFESPQLPTISYNTSDQNDYLGSWFQETINQRSNERYEIKPDEAMIQDCLKDFKDNENLNELRNQILGDYIIDFNFRDNKGNELINVVQTILQSIYLHCLWVQQVTKDCSQNSDKLYFIVLFWNMYQGSIQKMQKSFQKYFDQLDKVCDSLFGTSQVKHQTILEVVMVRIWCSVVMGSTYFGDLNKIFITLFNENRKTQNKKKQITSLLQNYQSYLIDISTTLHSSNWLGHSQFKISHYFTELLQETSRSLTTYYTNLEFQNQQQDIMIQKDLDQLLSIFPEWIIDNCISQGVMNNLVEQNKVKLKNIVERIPQHDPKLPQSQISDSFIPIKRCTSITSVSQGNFDRMIRSDFSDVYVTNEPDYIVQSDNFQSQITQASGDAISWINSFYNSRYPSIHHLKELLTDISPVEADIINNQDKFMNLLQAIRDRIHQRDEIIEITNALRDISFTQTLQQELLQNYFQQPTVYDIIKLHDKQQSFDRLIREKQDIINLEPIDATSKNLAHKINLLFNQN